MESPYDSPASSDAGEEELFVFEYSEEVGTYSEPVENPPQPPPPPPARSEQRVHGGNAFAFIASASQSLSAPIYQQDEMQHIGAKRGRTRSHLQAIEEEIALE